MPEIQLTRGLVARVDDADLAAVLAGGPWNAHKNKRAFYARHRIDVHRSVFMHTFLTGWPLVDHINGDGLDNRRANLRPATASQNCGNRPQLNDNNTSGFKGVTRHRSSRWIARCAGVHVGVFDTAEDAALAYDAAAIARWGEFARPNFPREISA